jgi:hypothetical protein
MLFQPARPIRRPLLWLTATAVALFATLALSASSAKAGVLVASAPNCSDFELSQPFLPWVDTTEYFLNPGGDFENSAAGWNLDGASVVDGNEPWKVSNAADSKSLSLPNGSSATSSTVCVGLEHPTMRFFARNSGSLLATLRVDVNFEDAAGNVVTLPIGLVTGLGGWKPSAPMVVLANLLPLLPGEYTPVTFTFTPQGGNWKIDDVYVDPKRH